MFLCLYLFNHVIIIKIILIKILIREEFVQSKQHTMELFLEWFTRTQIFELFIRQKFETNYSQSICYYI